MAGAEAPDIYSGIGASYVWDGTEIGDWVSDFEADFEDDVQEFQGSNNTPMKRVESGRTYGLTFTAARHPTPDALLEEAYFTTPKPTKSFVVTRAGRATTYDVKLTHLTDTGGSGDTLTYDVECIVIGEPTRT